MKDLMTREEGMWQRNYNRAEEEKRGELCPLKNRYRSLKNRYRSLRVQPYGNDTPLVLLNLVVRNRLELNFFN